MNAKKSKQDRETLPISSSIKHGARYFLNDNFEEGRGVTNFPLFTGYELFIVFETLGLKQSSCSTSLLFFLLFHWLKIIESISISVFSWETAKPRTSVTLLQFYAVSISNFSEVFVAYRAAMLFFVKSVNHLKNMKNSFIRVQKSNWNITGENRSLSIAFKPRVQFLMPKNLAVNHLLLEAVPNFQTWTASEDRADVTFSGLRLTMKNLKLKSLKANPQQWKGAVIVIIIYSHLNLFFRFWLPRDPQLVLHNQLALAKFGRRLRSVVKWRQ